MGGLNIGKVVTHCDEQRILLSMKNFLEKLCEAINSV